MTIKNILLNKKGDGKYLSIWWFFCLILIAGAIVLGVSMMAVSDVETKKVESEIMVSRVVDCVIDQGYLNQDIVEDKFDIFEECSLNRELIDTHGAMEDEQRGEYYLSYEVYNFEDCENDLGEINCEKDPIVTDSFGPAGFVEQCGLRAAGIRAEHYPECSEEWIYTLNKEGERLLLFVRTGSNQFIRSV